MNLPEFRVEGLECLKLLEKISGQGRFNYAEDCEKGLHLKEWVKYQEMVQVFSKCKEPCVEVFWSNSKQTV